MLNLLSRRDHSEKELIQKLIIREFATEEIEKAILYAREHDLIGESTKLAENMAQSLHRRKKGIRKINSVLQQKGLPQVKPDMETELEKAFALVNSKQRTKKFTPLTDRTVRIRLGRLLQSRGFTNEIINQVLRKLSDTP